MIDVLIIGAGGAGLTAALAAKAQGASVCVVGKHYPTNSQTSMAQGGINAALGNLDDDTVASHIADTLQSAHGLCDREMVETMCSDAPDAIAWLEAIGVPFSRTDDATIAQRRLGGASHRRACYSQDYTGLKILHTLYDNCLKEGITFLDGHYLLNLVREAAVDEEACVRGATFLEFATGEIVQIDARATILATGGYGSIYHGYTTNAYGSTGDGIAALLRAGGRLSDMEFVQFHPTALKHSSILISESARGEGGYLLNGEGERFVDELLPRDVVARAIHRQIAAGKEVFLDIRHLGEAKLTELLPQELHLCRLHEEIDPVHELIPIKPVAHYTMGGIEVDRSLQTVGLRGCFAVGECSNAQVHGANRLGGNSLLEIIVFGKRAGEYAAAYACENKEPSPGNIQAEKDRAFIDTLFARENPVDFYQKREALGRAFYHDAGIIRNRKGLEALLEQLRQTKQALSDIGLGDGGRRCNTNLIELLEFLSTLEVGEALVLGALQREESRGAHYREDFPQENDEAYALHTLCHLTNGHLSVTFARST
jgi:succinate dehydrogenase / fumarate reductase flavoprotein subunit